MEQWFVLRSTACVSRAVLDYLKVVALAKLSLISLEAPPLKNMDVTVFLCSTQPRRTEAPTGVPRS